MSTVYKDWSFQASQILKVCWTFKETFGSLVWEFNPSADLCALEESVQNSLLFLAQVIKAGSNGGIAGQHSVVQH